MQRSGPARSAARMTSTVFWSPADIACAKHAQAASACATDIVTVPTAASNPGCSLSTITDLRFCKKLHKSTLALVSI